MSEKIINERIISEILAKPSEKRTNREWYILGWYTEAAKQEKAGTVQRTR